MPEWAALPSRWSGCSAGCLLQIFYSVRSERLLLEQLDYNLLFRWFVALEIDEQVWNHAVSVRTGTGC
jgi:transposase